MKYTFSTEVEVTSPTTLEVSVVLTDPEDTHDFTGAELILRGDAWGEAVLDIDVDNRASRLDLTLTTTPLTKGKRYTLYDLSGEVVSNTKEVVSTLGDFDYAAYPYPHPMKAMESVLHAAAKAVQSTAGRPQAKVLEDTTPDTAVGNDWMFLIPVSSTLGVPFSSSLLTPLGRVPYLGKTSSAFMVRRSEVQRWALIPKGTILVRELGISRGTTWQAQPAPPPPPAYAEDFYLALDQPSQYLRTLSQELAAYDGQDLTIACKVLDLPPDASAEGAYLQCLAPNSGGVPSQIVYFTADPPATPTYLGRNPESNANRYILTSGSTAAGVRVYALNVNRPASTWAARQSVAGSADDLGGSYTGDLQPIANAWFGRGNTNNVTLTMQWVWGMVCIGMPTEAQINSWSSGVVDPRVTLGAENVPFFWRADSFDGSSCPNEGSGPVAPLSGVNCTIADKIAT